MYGSEAYLIDKNLKNLVSETFKNDKEMMEYNIDTLTSDEIYNKYSVSLETLPFMSTKRLVIFKRCDLFKQKQTKKDEEVCEYLEKFILNNTAEDIILVIVEGEKIDKRKKLYKAISSKGQINEFKRLTVYELKKWITDKLKENKKSFSPSIVDYLVNNLPNDLYLVNNEVNKLISYVGDKNKIEQEDLHICSFTVTENIFKLIDNIIYKDLNSAITILRGMLREGEPAMVILYMIIKQLRNIAMAKSVSSKGYTSKQIGDMIGVHNPYALSQLLKQCDLFTISSSRKSLQLAAQYEMKIKTGQIDFEKGLELLISNLNYVN